MTYSHHSSAKNSRPSSPSKPFQPKRHSTSSILRRRYGIILTACVLLLYYLYSRGTEEHKVARRLAPRAVLVVALDGKTMSMEYSAKILENRQAYAEKWGYKVFAKNLKDYQHGTGATAKKFAKLPLIRHAMSTYPYTETFWYLTSNALIMNPDLDLESHVLERKRLGGIMMRNHPVIPPESVIKTYRNLEPQDAQFILTQDKKEISTDSFIIRRVEAEFPKKKKSGSSSPTGEANKSEFGWFLIDTWFDPLYRQYPKFPKGDRDALQHMVQWHHTILSKLALIPQRTINSYAVNEKPSAGGSKDDSKALEGVGYQEGDLVVNLDGCDQPEKDCKETFERFWSKAVKKTKA